jgi:hypothetical protein
MRIHGQRPLDERQWRQRAVLGGVPAEVDLASVVSTGPRQCHPLIVDAAPFIIAFTCDRTAFRNLRS